jgi:hypothetical protein
VGEHGSASENDKFWEDMKKVSEELKENQFILREMFDGILLVLWESISGFIRNVYGPI